MAIDVSEEYVFHMGKSFALNKDAGADPSGNALDTATVDYQ